MHGWGHTRLGTEEMLQLFLRPQSSFCSVPSEFHLLIFLKPMLWFIPLLSFPPLWYIYARTKTTHKGDDMEKKKNIFLNRDGKLATLLQILIASMTFLLISIIGQGIITGLLYKLTHMNLLPSTVLESYFLSGILPETFLNILAGSLILL